MRNPKKQNEKVHFIGICGKGMSALAITMKELGYKVTGSDESFYQGSHAFNNLQRNKIFFNHKYQKENIKNNIDLIIIGKHVRLTPDKNKEVKAAFESGIKINSMPEALNKLTAKKDITTVAGSFGKSSVTALLAWCLQTARKDPSYFIAADAYNFKQNGHIGKGKDFIIEGDEYPSANWDNTSKFLHFKPKNIILISGEHDHFNVFKTEKDYIKPFEKLVALLPKNGLLIACKDGKNVQKIVKKSSAENIFYSMNDRSVWHPENIKYGPKTTFDLYKSNKKIINLETRLLGRGNIENIVGVSAFLLENKMLSSKTLKKAIQSFKGVAGRLDLKTKKSKILVYESFGSSYKKAKNDLESLRLHYPTKNITTVFEPHTFSWRDRQNLSWYKDVFSECNKVIILLPPEEHGKNVSNEISLKEIVGEINKHHKIALGVENKDNVMMELEKTLKKDDILVLMTSGDMGGLVKSIPVWAEKKFAK